MAAEAATTLTAPPSIDAFVKADWRSLTRGTIIEDYEIQRELGAGAFARVYLARQISLDRLVALKVSPPMGNEARTLGDLLARAPPTEELLVLTHVPPFPEACIYAGEQSEPAWLPWFTCIATGEVLTSYARAHPTTKITVLCGHSHGAGACRPEPNLEVRTGGWPRGVEGYGNPIVQATLEL